jgi:predicted nuclease of predicted toxin-antitoxin system
VRFLLDQDVYAITARVLRGLGHDVVTAAELGRSRATDHDLLAVATEQGRLFVTRDRDFGALVFVQRAGTGVIYLRMAPADVAAVHGELERVLTDHAEADLRRAFVVVEPGRHRFRQLSA